MLNEIIKEFIENPTTLKVRGRSLLYSADLKGSVAIGTCNTLDFRCSGELRLGPVKSSGEFQSTYTISTAGIEFSEHRVDFPKMKFHEHYWREEGKILYVKNGQPKIEVVVNGGSVGDPLALLFKVPDLGEEEASDLGGRMLVGGKSKRLEVKRQDDQILFEIDGQPLFSGVLRAKVAKIQIPRFKVNLEISR